MHYKKKECMITVPTQCILSTKEIFWNFLIFNLLLLTFIEQKNVKSQILKTLYD